jgi:hypothetical protein
MEYEVKYSFPNHRADIVRRLIESRFQVDSEYSVGIVTSIYFDTKDMLFYEEKRASTYRKQKTRLRWYADAVTGKPHTQAFWEVKNRMGTQRSKTRRISNLSGDMLDSIDINDPALIKESYAQRNTLDGQNSRLQIFPSVMIRYTRYRFIDSVNGSRINVDSDIYARSINPSLANERSIACLPAGVVEYKGEHESLSPVLLDLGGVGARKQAFSKYESVIKWVKSNQQLF